RIFAPFSGCWPAYLRRRPISAAIAGGGNILVMEEGQVVEQGTHAQLLSHHGRYQALWQAQMAARVWRDDGVSASGEWGHE
ncbi:hypothetical protein AAIH23_34625, partial [Pseudomonas aeruginosa]